MRKILTNPASAAIVGVILVLPITLIFSLVTLNLHPDLGPLFDPGPGRPAIASSLIVLGAALLLPVASIVNIRPVRQTLRAGGSLLAHPLNLALAAATLGLIITLVSLIVVDQYPCWIGVPNCD